ncbi:hypothetical protein Pelo_5027 [Pelomyxa schiedti]|nr:hypothetical protein Pelo_5027 [Pelomyxa schiedti]
MKVVCTLEFDGDTLKTKCLEVSNQIPHTYNQVAYTLWHSLLATSPIEGQSVVRHHLPAHVRALYIGC